MTDPDSETPEITEAVAEEGVEFWADPGPEFAPENVPEVLPDDAEAGTPEEDLGWTPEGVIALFRDLQAPAFNAVVNPLLLGIDSESEDWSHREKRLKEVAPAIAREWNRHPRIRAFAGATDRAVMLSYLLEYTGPRLLDAVGERRRVKEERAELSARGPEISRAVSEQDPEQPSTSIPAFRR